MDPDTILYEATITDPTVFVKPVEMRFTLKRVPAEQQILEYSCLEGERSLQHYTKEDGGKKVACEVKRGCDIQTLLRVGCSALPRSRTLVPSGAQTQSAWRSFSPPRLWDGKTPDFRGIWQVRDTAYVNIEGHPAEKGIAAVEEHHYRSA